ncbi:MAG: hypothetical protein ABSG71_03570 [Thermodesulfobacteriota bacterium]|jgi:tetratricopeptide (TPR) repeat protein
MAIISAFVGRSFDQKEELLWAKISKCLDSLKPIGFSWEDAEEAQAKPISDKVKEKIERNDLFIGILTKGDAIISGCSTSKYILMRKILNWLASYWIIQESGYAIGNGKKVIFLIETGLEIPGGLNSDFEYIPLNRNNLSDTFLKVNQIIANELATKIEFLKEQVVAKGTELIPVQKSEIEKQEAVEVVEEDHLLFKTTMEAIDNKEFPSAKEKFALLLQTDKVKGNPELELWAKTYFYKKLYLAGEPEALDQLKEIANKNPTNLFIMNALVDCYEPYDQHEQAIRAIEPFAVAAKDFDFKVKMSIVLSRLELKLKNYGRAKERLLEILKTLGSNSDHQNYLIYQALGDIFKEQGEQHIACFLYELSLSYNPTDSNLRFTLALGYGEIKKYALAVYHYKTYLNTEEGSGALNNLGIEYEKVGLLGKSVSALKRSESLDNTLASANLSRMFIEKGFYGEAENTLIKALEKKDHHRNVEYYLNDLKASNEGEEEKEKQFLEEAREYKDFALEFAKAISIPFDTYAEINGLWLTDYGQLKEFRIQFDVPNRLSGEHKEEILTTGGLLAALALPGGRAEPEKKIKKILFTGTITNRGIRYSIEISSQSETFLTQAISEFKGFGIFSLENQEIKFSVEKEDKPTFFTAKKKK